LLRGNKRAAACACSGNWPHQRFTRPVGHAKLVEAKEIRMADTHKSGGKAKANGSARKGGKRKQQVVAAATAGAAIGIGSAALVAALLYANRPKEEEAGTPPLSDPRFEPGEA
jgi:hypothetical protein